MKTFQVSCYGRARGFPSGSVCIQISSRLPEWWTNPAQFIKELVPRTFGNPQFSDPSKWRPAYVLQLGELYRSRKLDEIVQSIPDGAYLLCFEGDHTQCHRTLLAEWLNSHDMARVIEWSAEKKLPVLKLAHKTATTNGQPELF
jgi:hypothetical protein